ncbi:MULTISPECIES: metal ABC transporter solute-binding protein, Zn/Mn family [Burkholderiales]|uniref:metal ABC transporter solute-binding protein, Zn/Mn family n=1 Tax=Burkholderiales TaxID=80840 RepID=UPI000B3F668B|nr:MULTISPECIES: zinc ABC transporter substrate-binding protein [Burkholderiales]MDR5736056.1 zinc ABC transporter substrate-binding protein [Caballeronia sp. LZ025]
MSYPYEEGEDDHDDHEDGSATPADEHDHGDTDPHIWGNVQNAIIAIGTIRDALIAADPDNTDAYTANAEAYLGELETLDAWVKSEVAKIPEEDRKLVTSHDALGYYTDAYGFTIVGTVLGLTTEEAEPSAQQVAELVQQIQDSGVKAIFAETIENPAVIEAIAAEAGVVVGPELYTDALGEAGSDGDTYIKMITFNTNAIVSAILGE